MAQSHLETSARMPIITKNGGGVQVGFVYRTWGSEDAGYLPIKSVQGLGFRV